MNADLCAAHAHTFLSGAKSESEAGQAYQSAVEKRWKPHFDFIVGSAQFAPPPPQLPPVLQKCTQDPALASRFLAFVEGYESELGFLSPERLNAL